MKAGVWALSLVVLCFVLAMVLRAGTALATAKTAGPIPNGADQVEKNAQAGVGQSYTWRTDVTTSAVDLWAAAPEEMTVAVRMAARYYIIHHCDDDDGGVFLRIGPATDSPALTAATGIPLFTKGTPFQVQLRPVVGETTAANASVPIWAIADAGTITTCMSAFF